MVKILEDFCYSKSTTPLHSIQTVIPPLLVLSGLIFILFPTTTFAENKGWTSPLHEKCSKEYFDNPKYYDDQKGFFKCLKEGRGQVEEEDPKSQMSEFSDQYQDSKELANVKQQAKYDMAKIQQSLQEEIYRIEREAYEAELAFEKEQAARNERDRRLAQQKHQADQRARALQAQRYKEANEAINSGNDKGIDWGTWLGAAAKGALLGLQINNSISNTRQSAPQVQSQQPRQRQPRRAPRKSHPGGYNAPELDMGPNPY